jgi:hypothetical protein
MFDLYNFIKLNLIVKKLKFATSSISIIFYYFYQIYLITRMRIKLNKIYAYKKYNICKQI